MASELELKILARLRAHEIVIQHLLWLTFGKDTNSGLCSSTKCPLGHRRTSRSRSSNVGSIAIRDTGGSRQSPL